MSNKTPESWSWRNGPPKSETEQWAFNHRCEVMERALGASAHAFVDNHEFPKCPDFNDPEEVEKWREQRSGWLSGLLDTLTSVQETVNERCPREML